LFPLTIDALYDPLVGLAEAHMSESNLLLGRRELLKASFAGAGALLLGSGATLFAASPTPREVEGPFHPMPGSVDLRLIRSLDKNTDLTVVDGQAGKATGQVVYVFGKVMDQADKPLANATVEIWQACFSGRYNHKNDSNTSNALDSKFQYWGFAKTDATGKYVFKTILPGAYRNDPSWIRPPHIHYKVKKPGWTELTTQLYFAGTNFTFEGKTYGPTTLRRLNAYDRVLQMTPASQQGRLIATLQTPTPAMGLDAGARFVNFDIVMPN
jgi:protocatechuate 3,4-dioxygenase, beta subunit